MSDMNVNAEFLRRAAEARARATSASSFVAMDELLDIAAAWRTLAAEAERLAADRAVMTAAQRRHKTPRIRLVSDRDKTDAA